MTPIDDLPLPEEPVRLKKRPFLKRIFVGDAGLYAGWRIAAYAVGLVVVNALLFHLIGMNPEFRAALHGDAWGAGLQMLTSGVLLIAAVIPLLVLKAVERRPFADYGFGLAEFPARFALGGATGLAGLSALCLVLIAIGSLTTEGPMLTGTDVVASGAAWFGANIITGAAEEIAFRGVLLALAVRGLGWRWGSVVSASAFGLAHAGNGAEGLIGLVGAGAIGWVLCWSVRRSGTLAWAWGLHILWNWGESFLFGTPNSGQPSTDSLFASTANGAAWLSGGETGPEGSALVFFAILLMWFIASRTLGRRPTT